MKKSFSNPRLMIPAGGLGFSFFCLKIFLSKAFIVGRFFALDSAA